MACIVVRLHTIYELVAVQRFWMAKLSQTFSGFCFAGCTYNVRCRLVCHAEYLT